MPHQQKQTTSPKMELFANGVLLCHKVNLRSISEKQAKPQSILL